MVNFKAEVTFQNHPIHTYSDYDYVNVEYRVTVGETYHCVSREFQLQELVVPNLVEHMLELLTKDLVKHISDNRESGLFDGLSAFKDSGEVE